MFDYSKLLGRIVEKYGSQRAFAKAIGLSETSMSKKLAGKMSITTKDIDNWSQPELLDIAASDIPIYYFKKKEV